jgi:DNA polymerase-3 subunit epsilon
MREIVLDTETTGLSPADGHRLIEIGVLELMDRIPTGRELHLYIHPERDVPEAATAVHGIRLADLEGKPVFAAIADQVLAFLADDPIVAHNADFDIGFLNAELARAGKPTLAADRAIDTVAIARRQFPGAKASLDALCQRFGIDLSVRAVHGAIVDARLLAQVYVELTGGRQRGLGLDTGRDVPAPTITSAPRRYRAPRPHAPSPEELAAHAAFLDGMANPLWRRA